MNKKKIAKFLKIFIVVLKSMFKTWTDFKLKTRLANKKKGNYDSSIVNAINFVVKSEAKSSQFIN
jgi:hypothetical protein